MDAPTSATQWVDLLDPTADDIERAFPSGLHPGARDLLLQPAMHGDEPRPKLDNHGDYVFGVFLIPVLVADEDRVYYQEVDLVLTADLVLTVRKTPQKPRATGSDAPYDPTDLRAAVEKAADHRPGVVAFSVADDVAEAFLDLIDGMHDEIDELEDAVEDGNSEVLRRRISQLRHDLLHIRRTLAPSRDAIRRIVDGRVEIEESPVFPHDVQLHFGDVFDKFLRASEGLETARDLVSGVRDYVQAKVANDQNEVMKHLTVVASLLLLPTFIVGLYGQNFHHIPELAWSQGYGFSWLVIVATTILQLLWFRHRRWV